MPVFEHAWLLLLLPLALLPWLPRAAPPHAHHAALGLVGADRLSEFAARLIRCAAGVAIAAMLLGLAGPRLPDSTQARVGRGAEIVLLLDRSLSMDQPFGRPSNAVLDLTGTTKAQVARQLLGEFAHRRRDDLFGLVLFSTFPLPVLPFTQRSEVIQNAIAAAGTSRALGETDVGLGLLSAVSYFDPNRYSGSRVVVLVSDGGAQLDPVTRAQIAEAYLRRRVSLYWLYIRSRFGPGLAVDSDASAEGDEQIPERSLHRFFRTLRVPYRAFEATDPEALQRAIDQLDRLERAPLQYTEVVPGADLSAWPYSWALAAVLLLAAVQAWTVRPWR
jgi:mxaC protein